MSLDEQLDMPIRFTQEAAEQIREFASDKPLRVAIQGGGCSGFQYALAFDDPTERDARHTHNGVSYVIDPVSERYLTGTTIGYRQGMFGGGFTFDNPNARGTCGCGQSFNG